PPEGFGGEENGSWGDDEYQRECTPDEIAALDESYRRDREERLAAYGERRGRYFAGLLESEGETAQAEG
ncbi:MAG TPA: hypothetical protein VFU80_05820, partial [Sphingomicrobium sp.]|nr:hypothetical protein [Sphingomicrobium sp.]